MAQKPLIARFQRWVAIAIAFCVILYLIFSVWSGFDEIKDELQHFQWMMFVYAVVLTLSNYALRFVKWHYLLKNLNVPIPWKIDA